MVLMESNKRILLVEDDEVILSLLKELLERKNYAVACATNGQEALAYLRSAAALPAVILLDLMMPVMDGFEFMKEQSADEYLKQIPVIAMSADSQIKERLRNTTAREYFKKPVKIEHVLKTIAHYIN